MNIRLIIKNSISKYLKVNIGQKVLFLLKEKIHKYFLIIKEYFVVILPLVLTFWLIILFDLKNHDSSFLCIFVFETFVLISLLLLYPIFNSKNQKLKILFLILQFISLDFIFASIYYYSYIKNPSSYSVSNLIKNDKFLNEYNNKINNLQETNRLILLITEMENQIDTTLKSILTYQEDIELEGSKNKLGYGYYYYFKCFPNRHGTAYTLNFVNSQKEWIFLGDASFSQFESVSHPLIRDIVYIKDKENLIYSLDNIIVQLNTHQKKKTEELNKIVSFNADLGYIDFLYFSTITLTTTGYGDIIPNKSSVRLIVIMQTLFSVLFMAYGLTLLTTKTKNKI